MAPQQQQLSLTQVDILYLTPTGAYAVAANCSGILTVEGLPIARFDRTGAAGVGINGYHITQLTTDYLHVGTYLDDDVDLTADSASKGVTQQAVKAYIDTLDAQDVKITGAQVVAGVKTFTSLPLLQTSPGGVVHVPSVPGHPVTKKAYDDATQTSGLGAVKINGIQTIYDIKTFHVSPIIPTPTTDMQAATMKYVVDNAVFKTGTQSVVGTKTFSTGIIVAGTGITSISYDTSSSRKLKDVIEPFNDSALVLINDIDIIKFSYKSDKDKYVHTGFIAEDTPEVFTGVTNKTMSLADTLGVTLKAIQELSERVISLENKVRKLELGV